MARKLTAKEERFCQLIAQGKTQIEAHTTAYPNNMTRPQRERDASVMVGTPKLSQRIAELKERAMKKHDVTVESIARELEEARALASEIKNPSPMVAASLGKAKLYGLLVDKHEHTGKDGGEIVHKIEVVHVEPK